MIVQLLITTPLTAARLWINLRVGKRVLSLSDYVITFTACLVICGEVSGILWTRVDQKSIDDAVTPQEKQFTIMSLSPKDTTYYFKASSPLTMKGAHKMLIL